MNNKKRKRIIEPWIEDAQQLTESDIQQQTSHSLLKRTQAVDDFLSESNIRSTALVAPKGFGKTLMLKMKRMSLESSHRCIPTSAVLDRPLPRPPTLQKNLTSDLKNTELWESLWQIAFSITALKSFCRATDQSNDLSYVRSRLPRASQMVKILDDHHLDTPFSILHEFLSGSPNEVHSAVQVSHHILGGFSRINMPIAIFIDNIDEYLEAYINERPSERTELHAIYLRIWHNGQIGAWHALRRLNGSNPRIKIFISMRKEAYFYATANEPQFANLKAFAKVLSYDRDDMIDIIYNNIRSEQKKKLVDPDKKDAMLQFVGTASEWISNSGTGKPESVLTYWLRHCTTRPRDCVSVGAEISRLGPERRSRATVRATINRVSEERVKSLFTEVGPFLDHFYPKLLADVVKTNVFGIDELTEASMAYAALASETYGASGDACEHVFCALYSLGLVGIVKRDRNRDEGLIQEFAPVGTIALGTMRVLPKAETYLLHPALSDYLAGLDASFLNKMNCHNVIGDGLEWRIESFSRLVLRGDVVGFRENIMNNPSAATGFDSYWHKVYREYTSDLDYAHASDGDSITLADRSSMRVLKVAQCMMRAFEDSDFQLKMRFGGHRGQWKIQHGDDGIARVELSEILGVAARIEPLANPGDILISQHAYENILRRERPDIAKLLKCIKANYSHNINFSSKGEVDISKKLESPECMMLYTVGTLAESCESAQIRTEK
ncbi:hypothetical protein [Granulosicoccus antarcticus]|uniref:Uncharacterized protein n=1 Tax=Granulosicoccus antarcticus IMCC3135 TaxID=1192854 RepID=A0A2Z2NQR9_9GAMM|nr:hypothetical protein [Granulosicoccus antarcticus]ASJ72038.1 hypothetical protein IMCC3135_09710 [Granulosicoccus antarcticus IMCC3135]